MNSTGQWLVILAEFIGIIAVIVCAVWIKDRKPGQMIMNWLFRDVIAELDFDDWEDR